MLGLYPREKATGLSGQPRSLGNHIPLRRRHYHPWALSCELACTTSSQRREAGSPGK